MCFNFRSCRALYRRSAAIGVFCTRGDSNDRERAHGGLHDDLGSSLTRLSLLSDGCLRACIRHLKARDIRHCQGGTMGVRPRYDKTPRLELNVAFNAFAIPGVNYTLATP